MKTIRVAGLSSTTRSIFDHCDPRDLAGIDLTATTQAYEAEVSRKLTELADEGTTIKYTFLAAGMDAATGEITAILDQLDENATIAGLTKDDMEAIEQVVWDEGAFWVVATLELNSKQVQAVRSGEAIPGKPFVGFVVAWAGQEVEAHGGYFASSNRTDLLRNLRHWGDLYLRETNPEASIEIQVAEYNPSEDEEPYQYEKASSIHQVYVAWLESYSDAPRWSEEEEQEWLKSARYEGFDPEIAKAYYQSSKAEADAFED